MKLLIGVLFGKIFFYVSFLEKDADFIFSRCVWTDVNNSFQSWKSDEITCCRDSWTDDGDNSCRMGSPIICFFASTILS